MFIASINVFDCGLPGVSIFLERFRSTKCELAKVMNQQTCFQELLQHKDQAIKSLERKAGASHMNGSLKKDSKTR